MPAFAPTFALVDCNNFYASCERVFEPKLEGRAIAVLSNNDGCIIARSTEAKALGVPMGEPAYKARPLVDSGQLILRSGNYALYGDFSARVMTLLADEAPAIEIYSIDECFLDLEGLGVPDLSVWCRDLRAKVRRWTGIPVSIGLAPTKTLAKMANRLAKTSPKTGGVLNLSAHPDWIAEALRRTDVGDVWGIGRQWTILCQRHGIRTARDLVRADPGWVRQVMGKVGLRTQLELQGVAVHDLESQPEPRQSCCCSRSFGQATERREDLRDALTNFASRAAEKIRADGLVASAIQVYFRTDRFRTDVPQRTASNTLPLYPATASTIPIVAAALRGLERLWMPGFAYRKAGVLLLDLRPPADVPRDLFTPPDDPRSAALMAALDAANRRFGRSAICVGLLPRPAFAPWMSQRSHASPCYTTRWSDIPKVQA
jgi:DNA polymerase V